MSENNAFENGIVILGAGNVATHLALALFKSNYKIRKVYCRTVDSAKPLAQKVMADYTTDLSKIPSDADLYIIAVKDDAIEPIIRNLKINSGILVHTAGSISVDVFKDHAKNYGVFYPLQTFSKSRQIDLNEVPVLIEGNNEIVRSKLLQLAQKITTKVYKIDSEQRKLIHLAAVFSCNFVNHMYFIGSELMQKSGSSFELLKPLLIETVNKAMDLQPQKAQTGPALRGDKKVMENHRKLLSEFPEFEKIYRFVSESIYKSQQKKES